MWQRGEGPRLALAAGAGALHTLAFPKFGIAGLAWVAPGLLLASALGAPGRTAFRCGCVGGLVFFLSSLGWLLNIPMPKVVPGTGWLALSCFLSLYWGSWVWLCWRCFPGNRGMNFSVGDFALTPALSPGEREMGIPPRSGIKPGGSQSTLEAATSERIGSDETQRTDLPLPRGEGRGEGRSLLQADEKISAPQERRPTEHAEGEKSEREESALTPTLSPGEREMGIPPRSELKTTGAHNASGEAVSESLASDQTRSADLPLPKGEGRGEGEADAPSKKPSNPLTAFERLRAAAVMNQFLDSSWGQRAGWALFCAAAWVALEMIQARLFSGLPWNLLGTSQYRMLPLIQIASWCGVYGVSFLVAWFSVALWCGVAVVWLRPQRSRLWMGEVVLPLAALVVVVFVGIRLMYGPFTEETIRIALVQPSIPQTVIWNPEAGPKRFAELMALSEAALTNKPEVLVWPEAAMPSYLRWDTNRYNGATLMESVAGLARRGKVWMILGADDAEPGGAGEAKFFNNCFLINPAGEIAGSYRKQRLVIFGEYVPLAGVLPWLRTFSGVTGDFTAGTQAVAFALGSLGAKTSVLICFEDIFPHGARAHVAADTDFLVNITNDGWFGNGAQQWQHAANAAFRAVENGLPLVRCANNGLTCWIDAHGRMLEVYFAGDENIYRAGVKIAEVPLFGAQREMTIYWKNGDWFGWSCVGVAGMFLGLSWRRRREG